MSICKLKIYRSVKGKGMERGVRGPREGKMWNRREGYGIRKGGSAGARNLLLGAKVCLGGATIIPFPSTPGLPPWLGARLYYRRQGPLPPTGAGADGEGGRGGLVGKRNGRTGREWKEEGREGRRGKGKAQTKSSLAHQKYV
jgi:hypothetical protein